jgi:hypothetical protein
MINRSWVFLSLRKTWGFNGHTPNLRETRNVERIMVGRALEEL